MNKHTFIILALVLASGLVLSGVPDVSAGENRKHVTPYGDFCKQTSHYGMHKQMLSNKDAEQALQHYFGKKGLDFEILHNQGRFIKAFIKDNGKVVDTIIFDRHTGRIRSIY